MTHQFTDVSCNSNNHCGLTLNGSTLSYTEWYYVTVVASNVIGSGTSVFFPNQSEYNNFYTFLDLNLRDYISTVFTNIVKADIVRINIDTSSSTAYCNLLSSYIETMDVVCSITYGYPQGSCKRYTDSSNTTTGRPGVNLTIHLSQNVNSGEKIGYTVSLRYGLTTIKIVGSATPGNSFKKKKI